MGKSITMKKIPTISMIKSNSSPPRNQKNKEKKPLPRKTLKIVSQYRPASSNVTLKSQSILKNKNKDPSSRTVLELDTIVQ